MGLLGCITAEFLGLLMSLDETLCNRDEVI